MTNQTTPKEGYGELSACEYVLAEIMELRKSILFNDISRMKKDFEKSDLRDKILHMEFDENSNNSLDEKDISKELLNMANEIMEKENDLSSYEWALTEKEKLLDLVDQKWISVLKIYKEIAFVEDMISRLENIISSINDEIAHKETISGMREEISFLEKEISHKQTTVSILNNMISRMEKETSYEK